MAENDVLNKEYKDGLVWFSDRTGQIRYACEVIGDEPTSSRWVQPISSYFAGETIRRGQPVSVAVSEDYAYIDSLKTRTTDPHSYVVLTNPNWHKRFIGFALEYTEVGQPLHILPYGKIVFDNTKSTVREYNPGFTFSESIGKSVFIKGGYQLDDNDEPILVNGQKQYIENKSSIGSNEKND